MSVSLNTAVEISKHNASASPTPLAADAVDSQTIIDRISHELATDLIDLRFQRLPLTSDDDYITNDYETFKLIMVEPRLASDAEVKHIIRKGILRVHPDKLFGQPPEVQQFGAQVTQLLMLAREEALVRLARIRKAIAVEEHSLSWSRQGSPQFPQDFDQLSMDESLVALVAALMYCDEGEELLTPSGVGRKLLSVEQCRVVRVRLPPGSTADAADRCLQATEMYATSPLRRGSDEPCPAASPQSVADSGCDALGRQLSPNVTICKGTLQVLSVPSNADGMDDETAATATVTLAIASPDGVLSFLFRIPFGSTVFVAPGDTCLIVQDPRSCGEGDEGGPTSVWCIVFEAGGLHDVATELSDYGCKVKWQAKEGAHMAADATTYAAKCLASVIVGTGRVVGKGVRYVGSAAASSELVPEGSVELPAAATTGASYALEATSKLFTATTTALSGVANVAGMAASTAYDYMPDASEQWQEDVKVFGKSAFGAGAVVITAIPQALAIVGSDVTEASSEVVATHYGEEAASATRDGLYALGNVYKVVDVLSPLGLAEVAAEDRGMDKFTIEDGARYEVVDVTFRPGEKVGIVAVGGTGEVQEVKPGSQADLAGVKSGWNMIMIDGVAYSQPLLKECATGKACAFIVTFILQEKSPTESDRMGSLENKAQAMRSVLRRPSLPETCIQEEPSLDLSHTTPALEAKAQAASLRESRLEQDHHPELGDCMVIRKNTPTTPRVEAEVHYQEENTQAVSLPESRLGQEHQPKGKVFKRPSLRAPYRLRKSSVM